MIIILLFKIVTAQTLDLSVILNVIAVSSVYSTILNKIQTILDECETLADNIIDITTLYPDFKLINDVYIVHGPTGCGKSTLLLLLTGKLRIQNNPIIFSSGESGYLNSIAYQTDKAMANGFVINELILNDNPDTNTDYTKLFEILHGLCLYSEFLRMAKSDTDINLANLSDDDKVFQLLKFRKTRQFSSGQQQRLAIAKLLYTMTANHQVIALDEAFNRLDDSTAEKCIHFVYEYSQKDIHRIVLLATHQIELVRPICNKEISFVENLNTSSIKINAIPSLSTP